MAHEIETSAPGGQHAASAVAANEHAGNKLGAFLCWAVVFADIGTSVYYVPGILYGQVGLLAGLFVSMTLVAFLLLALKYSEVSVRFPEGGGVVTVAAHGLNPWAGAVGGMFILVDYFLTSAISSDSGLQYFSAVFHGIAPYVLPLTLLVIALLGVLNWWGIKESATVSAVIAVAAFVTDLIVLVLIWLNVPFHAIQQVFHELFSGQLTPVTLLTGFAGSFLAFSGLESISQLSPVMRVPRRTTVTRALALVVVTVGVTSPLLTIFSTTLLTTCTPHFTVCSPAVLDASLAAHHAQPDPNQFISELAFVAGGAGFGRALEVLTAVTASTLLIFASNTAIIGAYHVFLALSRMRFFPHIVERRNAWRGTPHISIGLATVIPMIVLVAVAGNVNTLGDMYAFGLLGAFSLTCIALDVIRYRERRGEATVGEPLDDRPSVPAAAGQQGSGFGAFVRYRLGARMGPDMVERARVLRAGYEVRRMALAERAQPVTELASRIWPDVKFYLGILTTLLVGVAWLTNLVAKPLATEFGGGLTVLGVAIAVIHYRYQQRIGEQPIFPMAMLQWIPNSVLVVLTAQSPYNEQVIRAACESADGHYNLVFLYEGKPEQRSLQFMQFNDPYLYDTQAQRTFSMAARICRQVGVQSAHYIYRVGGTASIMNVWRIVRPEEIIAEASVAKALSKQVSPQYVRFQQMDGVRVAHYVRHHVSTLETPEGAAAVGAGAGTGATGTGAARQTSGGTAAWKTTGGPAARPAGRVTPPVAPGAVPRPNGKPAAVPPPPPSSSQPPTARRGEPAPPEAPKAAEQSGRTEEAPSAGEAAHAGASDATDIANYVWTGTQLVRKDELEQAEQAGQEQPREE